MAKQQAVIYVRVSSKEQEEGGFSIPAQLKYLKDYAARNNFEIIHIFAESTTAKEAGRKEFTKMLKFLRTQKKACHLLCEKNDRLLRNEDDAATVKNLFMKTEVSVHLVKDNMILNKNSTPYEIFIFMMFSAVSSLYPRNLSNEVKKGMIEAAEEGHFPARVPIGYKNHRTSKKKTTILVDTDKAHFVIRAFELYSTGLYSYETLAQKLASEGFMIGKRKCYKRNIELILNNPFYMGEFNYKGKRYYDAKHTPLISKELFYTVQKIIHSKTSPHLKKHDFLYSGLIKSPNGYSLVGDIKKGKYIYYRSTDVKDKGLKLLKEEYVDEMVENMLKNLSCPPEFVENVMNTLKNILQGKEQYETNSLEEIQKKINILKKRLNQLYVDKLDGTISEEFYFDKHEEWQTELDELRVQFDYLSSESDDILERAETILTLCKNAYSVYMKNNNEQKRILLKLLTSHILWDGENLTIELKNTVKLMFNSVIFNMVENRRLELLTPCVQSRCSTN